MTTRNVSSRCHVSRWRRHCRGLDTSSPWPRYVLRKLGLRVCELGSGQRDDKQTHELNFLSARNQECAVDSISEGFCVQPLSLSLLWLRWERTAWLACRKLRSEGACRDRPSRQQPHPRPGSLGPRGSWSSISGKGRAGADTGRAFWRSLRMRGLSGEENVITET